MEANMLNYILWEFCSHITGPQYGSQFPGTYCQNIVLDNTLIILNVKYWEGQYQGGMKAVQAQGHWKVKYVHIRW